MATGVEAAGIVLKAIPLTLRCYTTIRDLASQYRGYDRNLRGILRDVETYEGLFKEALDQLLRDVTEEYILESSASWEEYLDRDGSEDKLRSLLGGLSQPVINSIQGVRETHQNIEKILLKLSGEETPRSQRSAVCVAAVTPPVIKIPFQFPMKGTQIQPRAKVAGIRHGTLGTLKSLRDDLKSHNENVIQALQLRQSNSSNSTRKPQRSSHASADMVNGLPEECLNAKAMQLASRNLYGLTKEALLCKCHQFHLRFDYYHGNKPLSIEPKGKSKILSPTNLEARFSFQVTAEPTSADEQNNLKKPHPAYLLTFTSCDFNSTGERTSIPTNCGEILASGEGYKRYFHGSNGDFVLQQSAAPKIQYNDLRAKGSISLSHLVTSRPGELLPFDQLTIAANLASSLVVFYSTPWLQNWSLQKIHFFESQEQPTSTPGLWTPHLCLSFDNQDQSQFRKNREIYSLGLVLLELGRKMLLDYSEEQMDVESALDSALTDVCRRMGTDYQRFVRKCLYEWSDQKLDFMEQEILESFLFEITVLQSRSRDFNPVLSEG